jgi:hypothetical protein
MRRRSQRGRNDSGSLLAATFVVALGAGCTVFVILAATPQDSLWVMGGIVAGMAALLTCVMLLRFGKMPSLGLNFWSIRFTNHRDDTAAGKYTPRIRKNKHRVEGANQPITASEAKEIQQTSANTWVPAHKTRDSS